MNVDLMRSAFTYEPLTGVLLWKAEQGRRHRKRRGVAGGVSEYGYRRVKFEGKSYMVHRIIWLIVTGVMPAEIDHVNGMKTDNRWCNLREASRSQNCANKGAPSTNTSGIKGVGKRRNQWFAHIKVDGRYRHLGNHKSRDDAAKAYAEAAAKIFGEFAHT